jgi:hypothetical protein
VIKLVPAGGSSAERSVEMVSRRFVEGDPSDPFDGCRCGADGGYRNQGCLLGWEAVDAGGDGGKGDAAYAELVRYLKAAAVAGGEVRSPRFLGGFATWRRLAPTLR